MKNNKKAMETWMMVGLLVAIALCVVFAIWLFSLKGDLGEGVNLIKDLFKNF